MNLKKHIAFIIVITMLTLIDYEKNITEAKAAEHNLQENNFTMNSFNYVIKDLFYKPSHTIKKIDATAKNIKTQIDITIASYLLKNYMPLEISTSEIEKFEHPLMGSLEIIDCCVGDVGNDDRKDVIVVLQYPDPYNNARELSAGFSRIVLWYAKAENSKYTLIGKNSNLIFSSNYGGVFGDPYNGISIENGSLTISNYGGSSDRWGYNYIFTVKDNTPLLYKYIESNSSTHTASGIKTIYDFLNGSMQTYTSAYKAEFDNLLITEEAFKPINKRFKNTTFEVPKTTNSCNGLPHLSPIYDYKGIDEKHIRYYKHKVKHTPATALNAVFNNYYPQMKQEKIKCRQEIIDNYSKAVSYNVADYYYADDKGCLTYCNMFVDENNQIKHLIIYESNKNMPQTEYIVCDDNLKIEKKENNFGFCY